MILLITKNKRCKVKIRIKNKMKMKKIKKLREEETGLKNKGINKRGL